MSAPVPILPKGKLSPRRPSSSSRSPLWVSPAAATARPGFLELSGRQRPPIRARGGARLLCIMPAARPRRQGAGSGGGASARFTNRREAGGFAPPPTLAVRRTDSQDKRAEISDLLRCISLSEPALGAEGETEAWRGRYQCGVYRDTVRKESPNLGTETCRFIIVVINCALIVWC
ncbi:hypothetical protein NN561_013802 [Cricetulus griseus]